MSLFVVTYVVLFFGPPSHSQITPVSFYGVWCREAVYKAHSYCGYQNVCETILQNLSLK